MNPMPAPTRALRHAHPRLEPPHPHAAFLSAAALAILGLASAGSGCRNRPPTTSSNPAGAETAPSPATAPGAASAQAPASPDGTIASPTLDAPDAARQRLAAARATLGAGDPALADTIADVVDRLAAAGEWESAQPLAREALDLCRNAWGVSHERTLAAKERLAACLADAVWANGDAGESAAARAGEAVALLREVVRGRTDSRDPTAVQARCRARLGAALVVAAFVRRAEPAEPSDNPTALLNEADELLAAARAALSAEPHENTADLESFAARWIENARWTRQEHPAADRDPAAP